MPGSSDIRPITDFVYVVVDLEGVVCGHLHASYSDAALCPLRDNPAHPILRLRTKELSVQHARVNLSNGDVDHLGGTPPGRPEGDRGSVHATAIIGAGARIGENVRIGAFSIVDDGVVIGHDSVIGTHCVLKSGTVLGHSATIDCQVVIGGRAQHLGMTDDVDSGVVIGDRVVIRESATIHRSHRAGESTRIGDDVTMMVNSHVGHDCRLAEHVVLANNVMLAGHTDIGAYAFLGGGVGVHQHVRIGEGVMIGGNASITLDIPPFTLVAERNRIYGLNQIGLRRRHVSRLDVADLKRCFHAVFFRPGDVRDKAAAAARAGLCGTTDSGRKFLEFFAGGRRGFARRRGLGEERGRQRCDGAERDLTAR